MIIGKVLPVVALTSTLNWKSVQRAYYVISYYSLLSFCFCFYCQWILVSDTNLLTYRRSSTVYFSNRTLSGWHWIRSLPNVWRPYDPYLVPVSKLCILVASFLVSRTIFWSPIFPKKGVSCKTGPQDGDSIRYLGPNYPGTSPLHK